MDTFLTIVIVFTAIFVGYGTYYLQCRRKAYAHANTCKFLQGGLKKTVRDPHLSNHFIDSLNAICEELAEYAEIVQHASFHQWVELESFGAQLIVVARSIRRSACADIETRTATHTEYKRLLADVTKALDAHPDAYNGSLKELWVNMVKSSSDTGGRGISHALFQVRALHARYCKTSQ